MADVRIFDAKQSTLENPISALADQPDMEADELKEYFDKSPKQLLRCLNLLTDALLSSGAAADIGFEATDAIPRHSVQSAIEYVRSHSSSGGPGGPVSNIARSQLDSDLIGELDGMGAGIAQLEKRVDSIGASGVADGSIGREKLDKALNNELNSFAAMDKSISLMIARISDLNDRVSALE